MANEKIEVKPEEKLGDMFFTGEMKANKTDNKETEFHEKGANIKFNQPYDIKFTIGSENFQNLMEFLGTVGYDVAFRFGKKELQICILDSAKTHSIVIVSKSVEFAEYIVPKDMKDDEERIVYVDIEEEIDEMSINKELPVEVYIDTLINKTIYIVNGKEQFERRTLNNGDESSGTLGFSKVGYATIKRMMNNENQQKVVVTQGAMKNLMASLSKKYPKVKEKIKICNVILKKNELEISLESDLKKNRMFLNGQDLMVYPLREDTVGIDFGYLVKFNKLKLNSQVNLYLCGQLPIVFECKFGGGNMTVYFMIAPYAPSSD